MARASIGSCRNFARWSIPPEGAIETRCSSLDCGRIGNPCGGEYPRENRRSSRRRSGRSSANQTTPPSRRPALGLVLRLRADRAGCDGLCRTRWDARLLSAPTVNERSEGAPTDPCPRPDPSARGMTGQETVRFGWPAAGLLVQVYVLFPLVWLATQLN